eukprot:scaffold168431_cov30-Tisochrysis_lutea.AAC.5
MCESARAYSIIERSPRGGLRTFIGRRSEHTNPIACWPSCLVSHVTLDCSSQCLQRSLAPHLPRVGRTSQTLLDMQGQVEIHHNVSFKVHGQQGEYWRQVRTGAGMWRRESGNIFAHTIVQFHSH